MHSRLMDFLIPAGKYYLADAGFALCDTLLVPYRGVWYHLAEWGRAAVRYVEPILHVFRAKQLVFSPVNKEELFNLRHAQARNVIECIFGVLKNCWDILNRPAQYDMNVQAKIPPGLAAVHNFIMDNDNTDIYHYLDILDNQDVSEPACHEL
jgi:hypothetical protein